MSLNRLLPSTSLCDFIVLNYHCRLMWLAFCTSRCQLRPAYVSIICIIYNITLNLSKYNISVKIEPDRSTYSTNLQWNGGSHIDVHEIPGTLAAGCCLLRAAAGAAQRSKRSFQMAVCFHSFSPHDFLASFGLRCLFQTISANLFMYLLAARLAGQRAAITHIQSIWKGDMLQQLTRVTPKLSQTAMYALQKQFHRTHIFCLKPAGHICPEHLIRYGACRKT